MTQDSKEEEIIKFRKELISIITEYENTVGSGRIIPSLLASSFMITFLRNESKEYAIEYIQNVLEKSSEEFDRINR